MARVVEGERGRADPGRARQQARLDEDLEAVADPQDQAVALAEPAEGVAQDGPQPGRQDPAGAEVVAVGEAAGEGQDLERVEGAGRLDDPADVPGLGLGPRQSPGEGRLLVAVRPGRPQDEDAGLGHGSGFLERMIQR